MFRHGPGFGIDVSCAYAGFVAQMTQEEHGMHAVLSFVAVGGGVSIVPESMRAFGRITLDAAHRRAGSISGGPGYNSCAQCICENRRECSSQLER